jgi:hypothetical protein
VLLERFRRMMRRRRRTRRRRRRRRPGPSLDEEPAEIRIRAGTMAVNFMSCLLSFVAGTVMVPARDEGWVRGQ